MFVFFSGFSFFNAFSFLSTLPSLDHWSLIEILNLKVLQIDLIILSVLNFHM